MIALSNILELEPDHHVSEEKYVVHYYSSHDNYYTYRNITFHNVFELKKFIQKDDVRISSVEYFQHTYQRLIPAKEQEI